MVSKRKITESFEDSEVLTKKLNNNESDDEETENETTTTTTGTASGSSKNEILNILTNEKIKELTISEMKEWFKEVSYQLLNNCVLMINGKVHMLVEIEYYFKGYKHVDHFAHGDVMQYEKGTWYFHRTNGAGYKGGSFKGLDITFGENESAYGGILIRSIQNCVDKTIIDGPSLCVDHILKTTDSKDILDFIGKNGRSIFESENSMLYFKTRDQCIGIESEKKLLPPVVAKGSILACARVGLTFKRYKATQEFYIGGDYRFIRLPDKVKKGKHYMTVSLLLKGNDSVSIKNQIGSTAASIEKIRTQIKAGEKKLKKDLPSFKGELSTDEMCQLLALCDKLSKEKGDNIDDEVSSKDENEEEEDEEEDE